MGEPTLLVNHSRTNPSLPGETSLNTCSSATSAPPALMVTSYDVNRGLPASATLKLAIFSSPARNGDTKNNRSS